MEHLYNDNAERIIIVTQHRPNNRKRLKSDEGTKWVTNYEFRITNDSDEEIRNSKIADLGQVPCSSRGGWRSAALAADRQRGCRRPGFSPAAGTGPRRAGSAGGL